MTPFQIIALLATGICFIVFLLHFIRIIRLGKPKEYAPKAGNVSKAVLYSNTGGMMPWEKESAFLHLPSYTLGILLHLGTFTSFLIFFLSFFPFFNRWLTIDSWFHYLIALFLIITFGCGIILLIKRIIYKSLHAISNIDDYLSNLFTSFFHLVSVLYLLYPASKTVLIIYYIEITLLLLYMPIGKLKHLLYYFSARYHLGLFFGWRNVWPPQKKKTNLGQN